MHSHHREQLRAGPAAEVVRVGEDQTQHDQARRQGEHGLEHVTRAVVSALSPYAGSAAYRTHFADGRPNGWPADALSFEHARRALVGELLQMVSGAEAGKVGDLERNIPWRRLMAATDVIRIYADGVRIRSLGTPSHPGLSVESVLTLENLTRVPLSGTVRAVDPLDGWSVAEEPVPFDTLQPQQAVRVGVTADVTSMPATTDGGIPLTFEFSLDGGASQRVTVRAAYVVALPFGETITIDGDLSDWPVTTGNVASNFKLISGSPVDRPSGEDPRPRHSTTVFVLRDESHLYLAVNCETPMGEARPTTRRKRVAYDDLIPVTEELVEFLIDPFNTGTRSPTDLYHIVIKRDGDAIYFWLKAKRRGRPRKS